MKDRQGGEAKKTDKRGYNLSTDFNTTLLVLENLSVGAEKKIIHMPCHL